MRGGAYRIRRPLGKGGMGAVYLAEDMGAFGRLRVIKEMLDYFDSDDLVETQKAQKRFEDEARTLATLKHPGIPDILAYFSEGRRNYIVMEYIEGENLETGLTHVDDQGRTVRGKPYPLDKVLRWGVDICKVLEYLSSRQPPVVHQDIKPANLILDSTSGLVRLVDFGTAKARLVQQAGGTVGLQQSSVYGTMGYAPREQCAGRSEPRSDVYALAATLYHLLTDDDPRGHPFSFPQLDRIPSDVRVLLERALAHEVKQRISASELRAGLEACIARRSASTAPFAFKNGDLAHDPAMLVSLCDQHWDEARGYLYDGGFERWFKALNRHDLVTQTAGIRSKWNSDRDRGLEEFLQMLEPGLPKPTPKVTPAAINFGMMGLGECKQEQLIIENRAGRGYLSGTIAVDQAAKWLQVSATHFSGPRTTITVTADTAAEQYGTRLRTGMRVESPYAPVRTVPVRASVIFPWQRILRRAGIHALIGGGVGLGMVLIFAAGQAIGIEWLAGLVIPLALTAGLHVRHRRAKRAGLGCAALFIFALFWLFTLTASTLFERIYSGSTFATYRTYCILGMAGGVADGLWVGLRELNKRTTAVLAAGAIYLALVGMAGGGGLLIMLEERIPTDLLVGSMPTVTVTLTHRPTSTPIIPRTPTPTRRGPTPTPSPIISPASAWPAYCPSAEVCITHPVSGTVVQGTVVVRGVATHPQFDYYKFECRSEEFEDEWHFIGTHVIKQPVPTVDTLLTWDTSVYPPGRYTLRLTVVKRDGNVCVPSDVSVVIR